MVDISNLTPAEMAQLLGKPEGEVGSAIRPVAKVGLSGNRSS